MSCEFPAREFWDTACWQHGIFQGAAYCALKIPKGLPKGNNILAESKREQDNGYAWQSRVLQPWESNPRELVSWYDVLNFSAESYYSFGRALRDIKADCHIAAARCVDGKVLFAMPHPIDDKAREKAIKHLRHVADCSKQVGMKITSDTAIELISKLQSSQTHNFQWLYDQIGNIEGIAVKELRNKAFFYIPPERMEYWPKQADPYAFGKMVADKFPSTTFDANSAAHCLATSLSTAAVFHLMRVLETALSVVGKPFGVSLAHTNWAPAIEEIESKIRDMHKNPAWKSLPDCKEQQAFYAQAVSYFAIVKDAWRNHTMHVRAKYVQDEAEQMFMNVKAFMQKLAERLAE